MTESEWLTSTDPAAMLEAVRGKVSDRKLRLFGVGLYLAFLRLRKEDARWDPRPDEAWIDSFGATKPSCEWNLTKLSPLEFAERSIILYTLHEKHPRYKYIMLSTTDTCHLLRDIIGNPFRPVTLPNGDGEHEWHLRMGLNCCRKCGTVQRRDGANGRCGGVVGVEVRSWLTPTALSLAEAAYQERGDDGTLDPVRLSILADALEESGCSEMSCQRCRGKGELSCSKCSGEGCSPYGIAANGPCTAGDRCPDCNGAGSYSHPILAHLRSPGPHVRGCWVLDLLLSRE